MYKLISATTWYDLLEETQRKAGEIFAVANMARARKLLVMGLARPVSTDIDTAKRKKCVICMEQFSTIGGIETSVLSLCEHFPGKITVATRGISNEWFLRIGEVAEIIIDPTHEVKLKADVVILEQWDAHEWLDYIEAKKVYQVCHADYRTFQKSSLAGKVKDKRVSNYLAVSQIAKESAKEVFGVDAEIIPNVPKGQCKNRQLVFGYFGRLSEEKNPQGLLRFIQLCGDRGKFIIASDGEHTCPAVWRVLRQMRNVWLLEPTIDTALLMRICDYTVQLSLTEASCETVRESLDIGTPVVVSDIPAFKFIKGSLGMVIPLDFDEKYVDKVFDRPLTRISREDWKPREMDKRWTKIVGGTL